MSAAQPADVPPDDAGEAQRKLLLVSLQESVVALPAEALVEVLPARPYASLPGADRAVAGLVNRRGRMLTVVDLGVVREQHPAATDPAHRVVVVAWREKEIGLAVKDVLQITEAWWTDDDPPPADAQEGSEPGSPPDDYDGGADQQLEEIELEALFAPLFGGDDEGDADETETERP